MEKPEISIVIPSYDSSLTISRCLSSLHSQQGEVPRCEVIVIDSSEDPSARRLIRENWPTVKVVELPKRTYAGPSRNAGTKAAQGKYLAFIDADCIADSEWVLSLWRRFQEGWAAIGGSIENEDKRSYWNRAEYLLELLEFSPKSKPRDALFLSSANSGYLKALFERCGGFPELRLGEDMLLAEEIRKTGVDVRFFPEIKVSHVNITDFRKFFKKQVLHGMYSVIARRRARLPGSFLLRHPYLLPALPFLRTVRVLQRIQKIDPSLSAELLITFPAFLGGSIAWSWGFLKALLGADPEKG